MQLHTTFCTFDVPDSFTLKRSLILNLFSFVSFVKDVGVSVTVSKISSDFDSFKGFQFMNISFDLFSRFSR